MALLFMSRKSAFIILLVLGIICLADGLPKNDAKEILVASACLTYAIVGMVGDRKKKMRKIAEQNREII